MFATHLVSDRTEAALGLQSAAMAEADAVSRLSLRLLESRARRMSSGIASLMACRTPGDLLAAQAALLCEGLELMAEGAQGLSEIVAQAAGQALRSLPD